MCTLTFIPKAGGYVIGMNRDERLNREIALLPERHYQHTFASVYPREAAAGGTWIAANSLGIAFALLNRNAGAGERIKTRSRGHVIPALIASMDVNEVLGRLDSLALTGMMPFRLAGFFPNEEIVAEWTWSANQLTVAKLPWYTRHLFSSGISDEMARRVRGVTCSEAWRRRDAGSAGWLRGLHASHAPNRGSFSVCVHRSDAASVSYTEIICRESEISMLYHKGQPCQALGRMDAEITLPRSSKRFLAAAS